MNKTINGNWEDDKEIYHQALQNGYDMLEILESVYKYGFMCGSQKEINIVSEILMGVQHE